MLSWREQTGVRPAGATLWAPRGSWTGSVGWTVGVPAALVLGGAVVGKLYQLPLEYPLIRSLNAVAHRSQAFDGVMHAATDLVLLQGAVFVSLIWYLWFRFEASTTARARLLTGTFAAALAGVVSRVLQLVLPSHLRPLHTPQLDFVLPFDVDAGALNHFNSFPSDHAAVFFGLSAIIYRLSPRLGILAFVWTTLISFARVYEGYHFPSDIIGAAGLGLLMVTATDIRAMHGLARRIVVLEQSFRPTFYLLAFLSTYQIASLFDDIRQLGHGLAKLFLHHGPFTGG